MTTNDELLFKNDYKNYQSRPNAVNVFENTFKLNQGKMLLDTVYNKEFDKRKLKNVKREPLVTKADMELRQQKVVSSKIPMSMETQTMADYKQFNPNAYRSPSTLSTTHQDLFKSKLNKNLYPPEFDIDECDDNALQTVSIMNFQQQQQPPHQNMYETNYACSFQDKSQASALINGSSDLLTASQQQQYQQEPQRKIHSSSQPNMMHKKNIVSFFFFFFFFFFFYFLCFI